MQGSDVIKHALDDIPEMPGIYKMLDDNGTILYIGKAKNLRKRVSSYSKDNLPIRTSRMVFLVRNVEFITTNTEAEALLLEANLIRKIQPKYNILLKDDKSFPYIKLRTDHQYPQILKYRGKKLVDGKFFGPFASIAQLESALKDIHKIFLLRSCSDNYFATRKRPCLQYQIKRCSAPCCDKISYDEYQILIDQAKQFLTGKTSNIQEQLGKQMEEYSINMEYEKAAQIRDRIQALSYVQLKYHNTHNIDDGDVIAIIEQNGIFCIYVMIIRASKHYGGKAYFPAHTSDAKITEVLTSFIGQFYQTHPAPKQIILSHAIDDKIQHTLIKALSSLHKIKTHFVIPKRGNKYELIQSALNSAQESLQSRQRKQANFYEIEKALQDLFDIKDEIERIEIYDNSHIMGKNALGAMVVAGREGFIKSEYRTFNIKSDYSDTGGDDYLMLEETLTRRLIRLKKEPQRKPNLIIIDGGKGHLSRAIQVFDKLQVKDIKFVAMSKGVERNSGKEFFHLPDRASFTLPKDNKIMRYLQILRDEAHNHAITTHRKQRNKTMSFSSLTMLPNIGEKRNKLLLQHFGSLQAIKNASTQDLCRVEGISLELAKQIKQSLE